MEWSTGARSYLRAAKFPPRSRAAWRSTLPHPTAPTGGERRWRCVSLAPPSVRRTRAPARPPTATRRARPPGPPAPRRRLTCTRCCCVRRGLSWRWRGAGSTTSQRQSAATTGAAVLAKLDHYAFTYLGLSSALPEVAVAMRRRAWQGREIPLEPRGWPLVPTGEGPRRPPKDTANGGRPRRHRQSSRRTRAGGLVAVALNGVPSMCRRAAGAPPAAPSEDLHDARAGLRAHLSSKGSTSAPSPRARPHDQTVHRRRSPRANADPEGELIETGASRSSPLRRARARRSRRRGDNARACTRTSKGVRPAARITTACWRVDPWNVVT